MADSDQHLICSFSFPGNIQLFSSDNTFLRGNRPCGCGASVDPTQPSRQPSPTRRRYPVVFRLRKGACGRGGAVVGVCRDSSQSSGTPRSDTVVHGLPEGLLGRRPGVVEAPRH